MFFADLMELDHPILDDTEQRRLVALAQAGDQCAIETLIRFNTRLIYKIAKARLHMAGPHTIEDLMHQGVEGLLRSVQKFDHTRQNRFVTYASYWIKSAIWGFCYKYGTTANMTYRDARKISKAPYIRSRMAEGGSEPHASAVAEALNMPTDQYKQLIQATFPVSISEDQEDEDDGYHGRPTMLIAQDATEQADVELMVAQALDAISGEPEIMRVALIEYMGLGSEGKKSCAEIAHDHGITDFQVRRYIICGIRTIRKVWNVPAGRR